MRRAALLSVFSVCLICAPTPSVSAQVARGPIHSSEPAAATPATLRSIQASAAASPIDVESARARQPRLSHPLIRSSAIMLGSAAGFAVVQSRQPAEDVDELTKPMAGGMVGAAVAGLLFSEAHPLMVLAGAVVGALPASGIANFVAGSLDGEAQGQYPLVAFSVPHGLMTSAFGQSPKR